MRAGTETEVAGDGVGLAPTEGQGMGQRVGFMTGEQPGRSQDSDGEPPHGERINGMEPMAADRPGERMLVVGGCLWLQDPFSLACTPGTRRGG